MKKIFCFVLVISVLFVFSGCGKTKVLHCDYCNREITVLESNEMNEDWIIYCEDCNEELFSDDPILGNG